MEYKLKTEYAESIICVPFDRTEMVGKFIDPALYPFMYRKYPDMFEDIKTKEEDAISINDAEQFGSSDSKGKI